jgi:hypothetical protein
VKLLLPCWVSPTKLLFPFCLIPPKLPAVAGAASEIRAARVIAIRGTVCILVSNLGRCLTALTVKLAVVAPKPTEPEPQCQKAFIAQICRSKRVTRYGSGRPRPLESVLIKNDVLARLRRRNLRSLRLSPQMLRPR